MAVKALDAGWIGGKSSDAGFLIALQGGLFAWQKEPLVFIVGDERVEMTDHSKIIYSIASIAYEVEEKLWQKIGPLENDQSKE